MIGPKLPNKLFVVNSHSEDIIKDSKNEINVSKINQVINKKTKRGRKSKNELPKNEKCNICLEYTQFSNEPFVNCEICGCYFHKSCYKKQIQINEITNSFICERCFIASKNNKDISEYKCFICARADGVLYHNKFTNEFYHEICIRFIPEISIFSNSSQECFSQINIRRWRYKNSCRYCREKLSKTKAVIKCANPKCKCYYHIPCAIQKQMIFSLKFQKQFYLNSSEINNDTFCIPFYCSGHNKKIVLAYKKYLQRFDFKKDYYLMDIYHKEEDVDNQSEDIEPKQSIYNEETENQISPKNVHYLDFDSHMNDEEMNYDNYKYLLNLNCISHEDSDYPFNFCETSLVTMSTDEPLQW